VGTQYFSFCQIIANTDKLPIIQNGKLENTADLSIHSRNVNLRALRKYSTVKDAGTNYDHEYCYSMPVNQSRDPGKN
jgi:hypothetical protein